MRDFTASQSPKWADSDDFVGGNGAPGTNRLAVFCQISGRFLSGVTKKCPSNDFNDLAVGLDPVHYQNVRARVAGEVPFEINGQFRPIADVRNLNGASPNAITAAAAQLSSSLLPRLTDKNVTEADLKIISVHTPKAGGTSIKTALANAFGPAFEIDYSEDPADPRSARQLDPEGYFSRGRRLRDDIGCLHGHFHPGQFNLDDIFLFTLLRHPVDNIISIYFFWRELSSQGQPLHDFFLTNRMDILHMARLPLLRHLYSKTYFGGFDMARFDLIGRHEDRSDALDKLGRVAGVQIDASVHENATTICAEREELLSDRVRMQALGKLLEDDVRFYERFCT